MAWVVQELRLNDHSGFLQSDSVMEWWTWKWFLNVAL